MRSMLLALLFAFASHAHANALTDTWWAPDEAGWGITVVQEGSLLQYVMFVYDDNRQPHWYSGALSQDPNFRPVLYRGELYETRGTPFTQPWNPAQASSRSVGPVSFFPHANGGATVDYVVDGRRFIKYVRRFTTQPDSLKGLHFATLLPGYQSCDAGFSGLSVFERGTLQIDRCPNGPCLVDTGLDGAVSPISMSMNDGATPVCSFEGQFTRYGRSGAIEGEYSCRDGGLGTFTMKNIEFSSVGFSARFSASHPRCEEFNGILSGVRASAR